ncbi:MAG: hypothetical protein PUB34_00410 [Clostridia bacterium]|nr:hypothetical protein [Clostridia bacterium]
MSMSKTIIKKALCILLCMSFLTAGFPFSLNADGNVARVGDKYYTDFASALNEAPNGSTVTLLSDVTLGYCIEITKNVIITSDGPHTVYAGEECIAMSVLSQGTLTLNGPVTVAGSKGNSALYINGGTFNMRSGSSVVSGERAINADSGTVNLMGGKISGPGDYLIGVGKDATLRMSGDISFEGAASVYLASGSYIEIAGELTGNGNISVATEKADSDTVVAEISDGVELSFEQIARFVSANPDVLLYRMASYICISQKNSGSAVVSYNGAEYSSIQDAVSAVPYGADGTLTVIDDISVIEPIVISGRNITLVSQGNHTVSRSSSVRSDYLFKIESDSSLKLAPTGDTLTVSGKDVAATMPTFGVYGALAIGKSAVITQNKNINPNIFYQGTIISQRGGTVNMDGGTVSSNENINGAVLCYGGVFNMTGGTIHSNKAQYGGAVYCENGTFNMSGGTIYNNTATATGGAVYNNGMFNLSGNATIVSDRTHKSDVYLANYNVIGVSPDWSAAVTDLGSSIININPEITERNTVVVKTIWGNADKNTVEKFTLFGEISQTNSLHAKDNVIFIGPFGSGDVSFYVNGVGFTSLQDAINAVPTDGTQTRIEITGDVTLETGVTLLPGQNIILTDGIDPVDNKEYQARTLYRGTEFEGSFITVCQGSTLTLSSSDSGRLVFDGGSCVASGAVIFNLGVLVMEKNVVICNNNASKYQNYSSNNPVLSTGGAVYVGEYSYFTLNGGVITGNYAAYGGAVYVVNGMFVMNGGYISTNSALYGGAVAVIDTKTEDNSLLKISVDEEGKEVKSRPSGSFFEMNGGEITKNTANAVQGIEYLNGMGGAVIVGDGATYTMNGGKIIENSAAFGNGISVGSPKIQKTDATQNNGQNDKLTEKILFPIFRLGGSSSIGENDDIYLAHYNTSYVEIISELTGINKEAKIKLTPCNIAAQNSLMVRFAMEDKNEEENISAAKNALENGIFLLSDSFKDLYKVSAVSNSSPDIVNSYGEIACCYSAGKYYDGLPKFVEKDVDAEEEKGNSDNSDEALPEEEGSTNGQEAKKTEIKYTPFSLAPKGAYTVSYELTLHSEMYKEIKSDIVGAFPENTAITMIDYSQSEAKVYYYIVNGKENISENAERLTQYKNSVDQNSEEVASYYNPELIKDKKDSPVYVQISLNDFIMMGTENEHYKMGKAEKSEEASADNKTDITEKLTFIVDFSNTDTENKQMQIGFYEFALETKCITEDGNAFDVTKSYTNPNYTVMVKDAAMCELKYDNGGALTFSYSLTGAALIESYGRGVAVFTMEGGFPEGTAIINGQDSYCVSQGTDSIIVPLTGDDSGRVILRDRMKLTLANYHGSGIAGKDITVSLYASGDGYYPVQSSQPDAVSEPVTVLLGAKDRYAVKVSASDSRKPSYHAGDLDGAASISFKIEAQCNAAEYKKVIFSLEKKEGDEYKQVPLQSVFSAFKNAGDGAVVISPGAITLVFNDSVKKAKGTYRMVFVVGDMTEYVKLDF